MHKQKQKQHYNTELFSFMLTVKQLKQYIKVKGLNVRHNAMYVSLDKSNWQLHKCIGLCIYWISS